LYGRASWLGGGQFVVLLVEKTTQRGSITCLKMTYRRINLPLLRNFAQNYGHLVVPRTFVVPVGNEWLPEFQGSPIGNYLDGVKTLIKKGGVYVEDDVREAFALGLVLDSKRAKSEFYLSALELYHLKHPDHKYVHHEYKIGENDLLWPVKMRGLKLGEIFNDIKHRKTHKLIHDDLKALQFDLTCDKVIKCVDIVVFEQYLESEGDLLIPTDFIVPNDDNKWSKKYHGFKLGRLVSNIRMDINLEIGAFDKDDIQKLVELGFPFSHHEANRKGIVLAFKTFNEKFGHLNVVQDFKIDRDDLSWPQETRGIALGETLHSIRNMNCHKAIHKDLIELGLDLSQQIASPDFERVFKALSDYKAVHGDVLVPQRFVVPRGDAAYSENAWGLKLGANLSQIRVDGAYSEHRDRLEALGVNFEVKVYDVRGFDVIYSALEAYKSVHGNLLVPKRFVVPQDDVNYPPETWGMRLGSNVNSIRNNGIYSEHRVKLEELGFVFKKNKKVVEIV
jgi:hypothetical protein